MFRALRRAYQVVFLALFLYLVVVATSSLIRGYPVWWFLSFDPLVAVSTALASRSLHHHLAWAIPLVVLTLIFGRFFCGWMCPMGVLHQSLGWLGRRRRVQERAKQNAPRRSHRLKYVVLLVMLGMAAAGSVQIGLLDPIASTWRGLSTVVLPAASNTAWGMYQGERHFQLGTLIAIVFFGALALNFVYPRFYCRVLCPLGALLGVLSRFALFRIKKDAATCKDCNACGADCQGAADPQGMLRVSECMVCLNCTLSCPRGSLTYGFAAADPRPDVPIDLRRRHVITSAVAGLAVVPLARASDGVEPRPHPRRIRPPGALGEHELLERCLKCGACMKACPTGGLQPAFHEAGLEGLWTPILVPRLGSCEHGCTLCGQVCPTGAIRYISLQEKNGEPPYEAPIKIGSARFDRGRCLPWANDTVCLVCEEVCPTSPKAIYFKTETVTLRDGTTGSLDRPYVDLERCIGCGTCENRCPIVDRAGVQVTAANETRDPASSITLGTGKV